MVDRALDVTEQDDLHNIVERDFALTCNDDRRYSWLIGGNDQVPDVAKQDDKVDLERDLVIGW